MKIIRFLSAGSEQFGRLHNDGRVTLFEGNLFSPEGFRDTGSSAVVDKLLAPIDPRDILCVGLNYKEHAAETGAAPPAHPVLFLKNSGAVQNPGDPIVLPHSAPVAILCPAGVRARSTVGHAGHGRPS